MALSDFDHIFSPCPVAVAIWTILFAVSILVAWYCTSVHGRLSIGEPPIIPYRIPWLGHGLSFVNDVNSFTEWVRSQQPASPMATVQVAGRHLYMVFDPKLASLIFRKSRTFIFDPFVLMTWSTLGATQKDLEILEMGAQATHRGKNYKDDGRRVLLELHNMSVPHLTGEPLERLTALFNDTLCECIDEKFPADKEASYEWQELDLCAYVKTTWTHASTISLFGTHVYTIWPGIEEWIWKFDKHIKSLFTRMPRPLIPTAYSLRDEGLRMCEQWESDAQKAREEGKMGEDPDWDPYWGQRPVRLRAQMFQRNGLSPRGRAASHVAFLWGQTANAIPIAVQVLTQAVQRPSLLSTLLTEIHSCLTGPDSTTLAIPQLTTLPHLKSLLLESLRFATSSPSPRVVREDCVVGPYTLRASNLLIVDSRALQMDPATWSIPGQPASDPANFWPERFLDGDEEVEALRLEERMEAVGVYVADATLPTAFPATGTTSAPKSTTPPNAHSNLNPTIALPTNTQPKPPKSHEPLSGPKSTAIQQRMLALRPFGGGTTLCPGRHFAANEILGGMAVLLLRLEIEVVPEELERRGRPVPDLTKQGGLFPDRPLMVRMRRRRA